MAQDDRACSRKLKSLRQSVDWENEAQRDELYEQLYELIRDWEGRYPDLRDIFRPEEIDWLLMESVRNENREMDAEPLVDFVVRCGYKDEADEDVSVRRTTALHYAIGYRFLCVVRGLFQIYDRYDVNYVDEESGLTHFHAACVAGYEAAVRRFLELGRVDPNLQPSAAADPPLHLALTHHRREVTKLLLKHGADPNLANAKGSTALHVMCEEHIDYDLADILFDFVSDEFGPVLVDARDKEGNTPLHLALRHGHRNLTKLLLARGADPNIVNEDGETPLHVNCQRYRDDDLAELFFKVNDEIKRTQVRVNVQDKLGRTPLQFAVARFLPNTVNSLLNRGADMSSFVFPASSQFRERIESRFDETQFNFKLGLAVGALLVVGHLERRGYTLERGDALTIMRLFASYGLFEKTTPEVENWYDDEEFARTAKKLTIRRSLSLYELIRLRAEEAAKLITCKDYLKVARSQKLWFLPHEPIDACALHLCEKASRGFFRRWALDPLLKLTGHQLPILCCEKIIKLLMNQDLWHICLAAAEQDEYSN
ncbi:tankyrase-2-like [Trichogramma pretiosum]|uniref:tankyrase-2-like n=1 Tax=Trichogramma pretiosum TaxID=7493 RepID=UPI0006C9A18F|nr:tankyrase-2-like [Trichogramma pretiosum]